jgi:hypothetical protein
MRNSLTVSVKLKIWGMVTHLTCEKQIEEVSHKQVVRNSLWIEQERVDNMLVP